MTERPITMEVHRTELILSKFPPVNDVYELTHLTLSTFEESKTEVPKTRLLPQQLGRSVVKQGSVVELGIRTSAPNINFDTQHFNRTWCRSYCRAEILAANEYNPIQCKEGAKCDNVHLRTSFILTTVYQKLKGLDKDHRFRAVRRSEVNHRFESYKHSCKSDDNSPRVQLCSTVNIIFNIYLPVSKNYLEGFLIGSRLPDKDT